MFACEEELESRLRSLKETYGILGIKAEFEAEGSTFEDLVRLRRMTAKLGITLLLKIGGVEAFRDLKDSVTLGVDAIVAPMAESAFGVFKFIECAEKLYGRNGIKLAVNIETRDSIKNLDAILKEGAGRLDGITIGRTDLSASWFDPTVKPDSPMIMEIVDTTSKKAKIAGFGVTVGGSINKASIGEFLKLPGASANIDAVETRKVILPMSIMLSPNAENALKDAIAFEEAWIRCKCGMASLFLKDESERLEKLAGRA